MAAPKGNKFSKGKGGAPEKYKQEYLKQATNLALLGLTDEQMAKFFEVSVKTFNKWKKQGEFLQSLMAGKTLADSHVAAGLYKRATGFVKTNLEKVFQFQGEVVRATTKEYFPPDPGAAKLWLINRQRKLWRDKVETGITDGEGNDVDSVVIFKIPDNNRAK